METKDIIGKKMLGFKFKDGPGFSSSMNDFIGKEGEIIKKYPDSYAVMFSDCTSYAYPYPEILDHLVEDEKTIDELLTEMKQLTSELWKTKI